MEWFGSPSRRMVMKLSLTVQLTDDLTGLPVTGSNARAWIEGQKPPIKKDGGRNVFVDIPPGEYVLNAEGGIYERAGVNITVTEGKAENITLRLLPNRLYPIPADAVCIEGTAEPDQLVQIYASDRTGAYKLLADAEKGAKVIGIYHASGINISGKLLKIISSDEKAEYIRIASAGNEERSEYVLSEKLGAAYPKIGTVIVPVSECMTDSSGHFMLLLKNAAAGAELICEYRKKKKNVRKIIGLSGENHIKADLG